MFLSNSNKFKIYRLYFINPVTGKMTSRSCDTKLKSEATKFLKDFNVENSPKPQVDKSRIKLSDVMKRILSHYKLNNSHNTYLSYQNSFRNLIRIVGDKPISFIGKSEIEDFKTGRRLQTPDVYDA